MSKIFENLECVISQVVFLLCLS